MRISDWSSDVCSSDLIRSISENGGEDRVRVVMLLAGPKIAKCAQEPGALGHLDQEFGDPHARKQGVEPAIESLRLGWSDRRHGRSEERRVGKEGGSMGRSRWSPLH